MFNYSKILLLASYQGDAIKPLIIYFCIAGAVVFLAVAGLVTYACFKYREKPGDPEPKQTTGNTKVEIFAVGISIALVVVALILSIKVMSQIMPNQQDSGKTPDVVITGHQWWWEASYPGTNITTANEIHLPIGKRLLLRMNSADVIHDWSVPALGPKIDMIPGRSNYLWLTIKKPGLYQGQCNQFCGIEHARMLISVIAQTPKDFQKWIDEHKAPAKMPTDTMAKLGAVLFQTKTCGSCHRIEGTAAIANVGPDLTHLESRETLLSGMQPNNRENLSAWISNPQNVKPGAHMPNFIFNKDTIEAIVDYLSELK